jgi:hypothetical protein
MGLRVTLPYTGENRAYIAYGWLKSVMLVNKVYCLLRAVARPCHRLALAPSPNAINEPCYN